MISTLIIAAALAPAAARPLPPPPPAIAPHFAAPPEFAGQFGAYKSPLVFDDGSRVTDAAGWARRRAEILRYWHNAMGPWPDLVAKPRLVTLDAAKADGYTRHHARVQITPDRDTDDAYLLVPDGPGPFPAVLVVYYEAKTGIGEGKTELRDFARQLARRGFVTLSLGSPPTSYYPTKEACKLQPL